MSDFSDPAQSKSVVARLTFNLDDLKWESLERNNNGVLEKIEFKYGMIDYLKNRWHVLETKKIPGQQINEGLPESNSKIRVDQIIDQTAEDIFSKADADGNEAVSKPEFEGLKNNFHKSP